MQVIVIGNGVLGDNVEGLTDLCSDERKAINSLYMTPNKHWWTWRKEPQNLESE